MDDLTAYVRKPLATTEGFESFSVPVYRASTIVFPDGAAYASRFERGIDGYSYGLAGTPTSRTLEAAINRLHGGCRTLLAPSGQAAISVTMLSLLKAGDKVLITDTAYPPVRDLAENSLKSLGIRVEYYDPLSIGDLKRKLDDHTRLIWAESPGSTTMELQDLDAVSAIAHDAGALVGCDNTWASPLNYKPIEHGVDIVVEALTKFFGGHSDVLMGSITVTDLEMAKLIRGTLNRYGIGVSPDDCSLVLRGMETMPVRIRHSAEVATRVVSRIEGHPAVRKVLFPSHPDCPGHDIWKRDFRGVTGVFTLQLIDGTVGKVYDALDALETISIGASWGGTRSLIAPMQVRANRTVRPWVAEDCLLRVSIGMESEEEILKDIERLLDLLTC